MTLRRIAATLIVAALAATAAAWLAPGSTVAAGSGPVAHWALDEASGPGILDSSGNGLDGILAGDAARIGGPDGGAISFGGTDGRIDVADDPLLEPSAMTIALWVKGSGLTDGQDILVKGVDGGCSSHSYAIVTTRGGASGDADGVGLVSGTGGGGAGGLIWDGTWHHLAFTIDVLGMTALYEDGVPRGGGGGAPLAYGLDASNDLTIGRPLGPCPSEHPFAGSIDDVRIYDRVLSGAEIAAILPPQTTATAIDAQPAASVYGDQVTLTATISPTPSVGGQVDFYGEKGGVTTKLGSDWAGWGEDTAQLTLGTNLVPALSVGDWTVWATYLGYGRYQTSTSRSTALTVVGRPVSVRVMSSLDPKPNGRAAVLTAGVTPSGTGGSVTFYRQDGASQVEIGTASLSNPFGGGDTAQVAFPDDLPEGSYQVTAHFSGTGQYAPADSAPFTQHVGTRPTVTTAHVYGPNDPSGQTAQVHDQLDVWATIEEVLWPSNPFPIVGTVTYSVDGVDFATFPYHGGDATLDTSNLSLGPHVIRVSYGGSTDHGASFGETTVTMVADVVASSGVGVQYTSFYPVRDGYRDTDPIHGTRIEPASVSIAIYRPNGRLLKRVAIPRGSGSYAYRWTGRTSGGAVLPSGRYRVVQTLTDGAGTKRIVTSRVSLSPKRLHTMSTTLARTAHQYTTRGSSWIGWQFRLPAAALYKKITFQVYARTDIPPGRFGAWDVRLCPWGSSWSPGCVARSSAMSVSLAWRSITVSRANERYGRYVRGFAFSTGANGAVAKVRLKVTYAVLR